MPKEFGGGETPPVQEKDTTESKRKKVGLLSKDPFENHRWRFNKEQRVVAATIQKIMSEKTECETELSLELKRTNAIIERAYSTFLQRIESSPVMHEEDKKTLLKPEESGVKMTPLIENLKKYVARYIAQSTQGNLEKITEIKNVNFDLFEVITWGLEEYLKMYEVDIPLYDKLYHEFDCLRKNKRYPMEVYIGRDGIYAWIGRRAQDLARQRKLGLEERKKEKEEGKMVEIHPRYISYSRHIRDAVHTNIKRKFLQQEQIQSGGNVFFFDTGYVGTIPEQIMKIMRFDEKEIENRIRLLSAIDPKRLVKGLPGNIPTEKLRHIEDRAKLEGPAAGLVMDEETGEIRHVAVPTSPLQQFQFMLIKQAITRHYWLKEHLRTEWGKNPVRRRKGKHINSLPVSTPQAATHTAHEA